MNNPCIDCTKRCMNCHSRCDDYKSFLDDLHKRKEWLKEKNRVNNISDVYRTQMARETKRVNSQGRRYYGNFHW